MEENDSFDRLELEGGNILLQKTEAKLCTKSKKNVQNVLSLICM